MGVITEAEVSRIIQQSLKRHPADRKRYWVAHLGDGRQLSEHQCRWVDVPLHQIVMLELNMLGNKYILERRYLPSVFVEFIQFKTAIEKYPPGSKETICRCIGWTDGMQEFIIEVDEKTGKRMKDPYAITIRPGHLHPQSKLLPKSQNVLVVN